MNLFAIAKPVLSLATSMGVGTVVGNAVKATTPAALKTSQKVLVGIGGVAVSTIASHLAQSHIEQQVDNVQAAVEAHQAQNQS